MPGAVPTRDSVNLYLLPKLSQRDKRQVTTQYIFAYLIKECFPENLRVI